MAGLPDPGVEFDATNTALVVTDPQNDFLKPGGAFYDAVKQSAEENNTIENMSGPTGMLPRSIGFSGRSTKSSTAAIIAPSSRSFSQRWKNSKGRRNG